MLVEHRATINRKQDVRQKRWRGKAAYRRRKWIAEPPNGWIKNILGSRQFSLRGLHRVKAEWPLMLAELAT